MSKYSNTALAVYAIDEILHVGCPDSSRHTIAEDMSVTAMKRKFQAGYDQKTVTGEGFANPDILLHSHLIEDFGVIAYRDKIHSGGNE
jgi:hypothetical protein